jgi:hypothetical protein
MPEGSARLATPRSANHIFASQAVNDREALKTEKPRKSETCGALSVGG